MKNLLNRIQKNFLAAFQKTELAKHFYWTGGTLLSSHYLHHRWSEDLDFFSQDLFFDDYMAAELLGLKKATKADSMLEQNRLNRRQMTFLYGEKSLKVEFVYFPFPALVPRKKLPGFDISIDSLEDIAANKVHAIFERHEPKDIFDLYWIMKKKKIPFLKLFSWVEKKMGVQIDPAAFAAKALQTASNLPKLQPFIFDKKLFKPQEIEDFFRREAFIYLKRKL